MRNTTMNRTAARPPLAHPHRTPMEPLERRQLLSATASATLWTIKGDLNKQNLNDVITVEASPDDPSTLQAIVNGSVVSTHAVAGLKEIDVYGGKGSDQ